MKRSSRLAHQRRSQQGGQILVIAVLGMIAMVGGVALLLEGGNAYAQQRGVQNGADAAANTGAGLLGQRLAGVTKTDADVYAAIDASAAANSLSSFSAYYTDVAGHPINAAGVVVAESLAAEVGGGTNNPTGIIPPGTQGVHVGSDRAFPTSFGRVIGIDQLVAAADATAVTGLLTGGNFLPVVFPVNIVDCETNGDLGIGVTQWTLSQKPLAGENHPNGPEYLVPLCKTGGGQFMILDLDDDMDCAEEVSNPPAIRFDSFPTDVASDNGNDCAKKIETEVNKLQGKVVMIPICDGDCESISTGSHASYHIIKVASFFVDYLSDKADDCQLTTSPTYGTPLTPIWGNGSSSCLAGWFVRYHNTGPVGVWNPDDDHNVDAIGIQLIK